MLRITLGLALGMLLVSANATAQSGAGSISAPQLDVAAGYTFIRAGSATPSGFNLHGGSISVAAHVNRWLGFVGDVAYDSTKYVPPSGFSLNITSYMFGPRLSYRGSDRITPFAHHLIGMAHAGGTLYTVGFQQGTAPPSAQNAFAMVLGGGLDVNLGRRWAIRAAQTDWLYTTLPNGSGNHQSSFRFTTGIVLRLGVR